MNDTLNNIIAYLKAVRLEWSKINWPERRQVIAETVFVVIIVFAFTVSVYLLDIIFDYNIMCYKEHGKAWLLTQKNNKMI